MKKLTQVDGKQETYQPTTLDQIWGDSGLGLYKTLDASDYQSQLNEMSKADLQAHSIQIGIIPVDNRDVLIKKLMKEFNRHVASYRRPAAHQKPKLPSKEAMKILSEGR
jgi:hypothetical protein